MKIYYTVYKVTNNINGKIYIGCHKTKDINDDYMGSGKYLKHSMEKHGIDKFKKEILFIYDNPEEMYKKESELVNEDFLVEENTYNLKVGGEGGWDYINGKEWKRSSNRDKGITERKIKITGRPNPGTGENFRDYHNSGEARYDTFTGKKHKDETKLKIGKANSIKQKGEKNSQFGTCWINHNIHGAKKIKKDLILEYINNGWNKGRV